MAPLKTLTLLAALLSLGSIAVLRTDPASNLARVRLIVVTTAGTTDIKVSGATLASYSSRVLSAAPDSGTSHTGDTLRFSNRGERSRGEAVFDLILADAGSGKTVAWNVETSDAAETTLEVFSTANADAAQLVDRFTIEGRAAQFTTQAGRLGAADLTVRPLLPHLVLAHYYPWYTVDSWRDPRFADRPLQPYSIDAAADLDRQAAQAHAAGIDAFLVSWQGRGNAANDRAMQLMLDSARRAGMHACVYFETYIVNPGNDAAQPTDPATMTRWIEDAVDMYGGHPAYLRVAGRPVIFVYIAWRLTETDWRKVLEEVRATGRNPLVVGDFFHSRLLEVLDGEYQYINVTLPQAELLADYRTESLRVRTFDLLPAGGVRRIWVASICPGYDDRLLAERPSHQVVDRANGAVYDAQWRAAVETAADWVVITTWNEYFENTHVEPSARYGTTYVDATKKWAAAFKRAAAFRPRVRQ